MHRHAAEDAADIAERPAQGLSVKVIEPQWIYDAWNYGHVSPDAIRNFLRYARSTWSCPPRYVTLVGDGTYDPLGFADISANNLASNIIPPYMAMVDVSQDPANPAVNESACETCYGLLDGDDPLSSPNGAVAVWASISKGVLWGHQYLQRGFYTALWNAAPFTARLGDLTLAGQRDLIANADFLAYMSWTYLILGDAATLVRVAPAPAMPWAHTVCLPSINR